MSSISEDSDIEVLEITRESANDFLWKELSTNGKDITIASMRKALDKYEVFASDTQISDMISLAKTKNELETILRRIQ